MRRVIAGLATLALAASLIVSVAPVASAGLPPSEWVIGPRQRVVLLTFDGQMKAKHLADVLATLAARNVRATFFLSGSWIDHHPEKAAAIEEAGHVLGNRGYSTAAFTSLSETELRSSISRAAESIRKVGGNPVPFLRAPKGQRSLSTLRVAGSMGYRSVRWTYRPGSGAASAIKSKVVKKRQAGAIFSMEPWRKSHRNALGGIIDSLRSKGFGFRTVEALRNVHAVRWDVTLRAGSSGPEVRYLEKELNSITYPAGKADGEWTYATLQAVYAYEKYNGLTRDGVVTPAQMLDLATAQRPRTPDRGPRDFVDVDISKQILVEVRDRRVIHTLPISSGNEEYYTVDGQT
ncbi:MAG: polysaccharide deacetylase family protein, partial [Actinomycetota bacterium]